MTTCSNMGLHVVFYMVLCIVYHSPIQKLSVCLYEHGVCE